MCEGLPLQHRVFDVMPELNDERDGPPLARGACKSFAKHPDADEHHDRVAVMQQLGAHQPRKEESEYAAGFWARPTHHVDLIRLRQVLGPVSEHDQHEEVESAFMPNSIQLIVKTEIDGSDPCRMSGY